MDEQRVVRGVTLALPPLGLIVTVLGALFGNAGTAGLGIVTVIFGGVLYVISRRAGFDVASMGRGGRATGHVLTTTGLLCCLAYLFASGPILVVPTGGAAAVGVALGLLTVAAESWLFGRDPLGYAMPVPAAASFTALLWTLPAACLGYAAVTIVGGAVAIDRQATG